MKNKTSHIVGLKELRENTDRYIDGVSKGERYTVVRRSRPVFTIAPVEDDEDRWETVIDFTQHERGGVALDDILSRL